MQLKKTIFEHRPESKASLDVVPWHLFGFTQSQANPSPSKYHALRDPEELLKVAYHMVSHLFQQISIFMEA